MIEFPRPLRLAPRRVLLVTSIIALAALASGLPRPAALHAAYIEENEDICEQGKDDFVYPFGTMLVPNINADKDARENEIATVDANIRNAISKIIGILCGAGIDAGLMKPVVFKEAPTTSDIIRELDNFRVGFFAAHGSADKCELGKDRDLTPETVKGSKRIFEEKLQFLFVVSCAISSNDTKLAQSLADKFKNGGVVFSSTDRITDTEMASFANDFLEELKKGKTLADAFSDAVNKKDQKGQKDPKRTTIKMSTPATLDPKKTTYDFNKEQFVKQP